MENVIVLESEESDHKKRQRRRKREQTQENIEEVIHKCCSVIDHDNLASVFEPLNLRNGSQHLSII